MLISSHVVGFRLEELVLGLGWISLADCLEDRSLDLWLVPLVEINTLVHIPRPKNHHQRTNPPTQSPVVSRGLPPSNHPGIALLVSVLF